MILNNMLSISVEKEKCNTPLGLVARAAAPNLNSSDGHEESDDRSVFIAGVMSKAKEGKEGERAKNHEPAVQFIVQLAYRSSTPHAGRHLDNLGEMVMFFR